MPTDLLTRPVHDLNTSQGERRYAHYIDKKKAAGAYIEGTAVTALCGYTWVPTRDPKKFPVCPECQEIYDLLPKGNSS